MRIDTFIAELFRQAMKGSRDNLGQNRIHLHSSDDNSFEFRKKEGKHSKHVSPVVVLFIIWIVLFFFSLFFVVSYDQAKFSAAWIFKNAALNMQHFYNYLFSAGDMGNIDITIIKLLGTAFTGAALAACGSLMQGSYRNVIAGPSTTGVMAGGSLGAAIYVFFLSEAVAASQSHTLFMDYAYQFCILGGSIFGTALILVISRVAGRGKLSPSAMLIAGMVFSGLISSITMIVQYYMIIKDPNDERIEILRDMMMGSFDNINTWVILLMMGLPLVICFIIIMMIRGKLNLLSFGDDEAQAAGLNVQRYRLLMMLLSAVMTALTVAFCGRIGFVGFMVPLVTRKITGPDMRRIIPCSLIVGAILLTLIYDLAAILTMLDSINVITSTIGCIVMAVTLLKKGGSDNAFSKGRGPAGMGVR